MNKNNVLFSFKYKNEIQEIPDEIYDVIALEFSAFEDCFVGFCINRAAKNFEKVSFTKIFERQIIIIDENVEKVRVSE